MPLRALECHKYQRKACHRNGEHVEKGMQFSCGGHWEVMGHQGVLRRGIIFELSVWLSISI